VVGLYQFAVIRGGIRHIKNILS